SLRLSTPPSSTLFPYTTLFRSACPLPRPVGGTPRSASEADRCRAPRARRWLGPSNRSWSAFRTVRPSSRPQPIRGAWLGRGPCRSEEHTSELQSRENLVCRLLL